MTLRPASVAQILHTIYEKLIDIEGRITALEEHTGENRSRLEDLEEWQEQTDERLDEEL
jgi:hypothetical protein